MTWFTIMIVCLSISICIITYCAWDGSLYFVSSVSLMYSSAGVFAAACYYDVIGVQRCHHWSLVASQSSGWRVRGEAVKFLQTERGWGADQNWERDEFTSGWIENETEECSHSCRMWMRMCLTLNLALIVVSDLCMCVSGCLSLLLIKAQVCLSRKMLPFQSYIIGNKFFYGVIHSQIHMWYLNYHYCYETRNIIG